MYHNILAKGVLLYGPPGVGKTHLVSSIANVCGADMVCCFFYRDTNIVRILNVRFQIVIQGPEVFGPYIGESEEQLRTKFKEAALISQQKQLPVILFIDEIVSVMIHVM